jgi:E3 Ubiquitin ligase
MGILFLLIGLGAVGFGVFSHFKGKRILAAPFRGTGELASNPTSPDPKGLISTEGNVVAPAQALFSPITRTPCLHYEVEVRRHFEKTEQTQDGEKTEKGSDKAESLEGGAIFGLDDGSGVVYVDGTRGGDFDTRKQSFNEKIDIGLRVPAELVFGELRLRTPRLPDGDNTTHFEAVEKIVPVGGALFALGKMEGGKIIKPGWRSMIFSSKGRDGLLASTAKHKKYGLISGGVALAASIPAFIFAPASTAASSDSCGSTLAAATITCTDNVSSKSGNTHALTIAEAGSYTFEVIPPAGKKFPLDARVTVEKASGDVVADEYAASAGTPAVATADLQPGEYKVVVKDSGGVTVKGGFDYTLKIDQGALAATEEAPVAPKEEAKLVESLQEPEKQPAKKSVAKANVKKKSKAAPRASKKPQR